MTDDQKKNPGLAFYATIVVVAVLIGYPLSFGPACWITSRTDVGASAIPIIYLPLTWAMSPNSDDTATNRISTWYAKVRAAEDWEWGPVHDPAGRHVGWMWASTAWASDLLESP